MFCKSWDKVAPEVVIANRILITVWMEFSVKELVC